MSDKRPAMWDQTQDLLVYRRDSGGFGTIGGKNSFRTFIASGADAAGGLVPRPPTMAGTTRYLREDGTWTIPSGGSGLADGDYGDVTVSGGGAVISLDAGVVDTIELVNLAVTTGKLAAGAVTDAKLRDSAALSVIGRAANSVGSPADMAAASNGTVLGRLANALSWETVATWLAQVLTTKGDLIGFTTVPIRKGVSGNNMAELVENSDQSDGLEWVDAPNLLYGDGFDGSATIAGTTTLTAPKNYTDLTVNSTLITAGFAVKVRGTLTFGASGIIHNSGGIGGITNAGTSNQFGGGGAGNAGFAGGSANPNLGVGTQTTNSWCALRGAAGAGKGGNGGQGNGGGTHPGATGTTPTAPIAARSSVGFLAYDTGHVLGSAGPLALTGGSGGAAGGGDQAGATAGSGGGGGGVVIVAARQVDATAGGIIHADGGAGGNGSIAGAATAAGGGGGGGGGAAILVYARAKSATLPTVRAAGGAKGVKAGTGADGTDGTAGYAASFRMI